MSDDPQLNLRFNTISLQSIKRDICGHLNAFKAQPDVYVIY